MKQHTQRGKGPLLVPCRWLVGGSYRVLCLKDPMPTTIKPMVGNLQLQHVHGAIYLSNEVVVRTGLCNTAAACWVRPQLCQTNNHFDNHSCEAQKLPDGAWMCPAL